MTIWENNIRMNIKDTEGDSIMNWMNSGRIWIIREPNECGIELFRCV